MGDGRSVDLGVILNVWPVSPVCGWIGRSMLVGSVLGDGKAIRVSGLEEETGLARAVLL